MVAPRERHIKLWTLEDKEADLDFFGKLKVGDGKSFASLRERLETANILDWPFEFWDVEDACWILKRIEALNDIQEDMYVIPLDSANPQTIKRRRLDTEIQGEAGPVVPPSCGKSNCIL